MPYLTVGEVVGINDAEIGPDLLADFGLLESAVLPSQQTVFGQDACPDIHSKAAALLHSLLRARGGRRRGDPRSGRSQSGSRAWATPMGGDTENVASRLETSAEPNRIHVSEDFASAVRDRFRLEPRGTMQLKGKGETRTFYPMA